MFRVFRPCAICGWLDWKPRHEDIGIDDLVALARSSLNGCHGCQILQAALAHHNRMTPDNPGLSIHHDCFDGALAIRIFAKGRVFTLEAFTLPCT